MRKKLLLAGGIIVGAALAYANRDKIAKHVDVLSQKYGGTPPDERGFFADEELHKKPAENTEKTRSAQGNLPCGDPGTVHASCAANNSGGTISSATSADAPSTPTEASEPDTAPEPQEASPEDSDESDEEDPDPAQIAPDDAPSPTEPVAEECEPEPETEHADTEPVPEESAVDEGTPAPDAGDDSECHNVPEPSDTQDGMNESAPNTGNSTNEVHEGSEFDYVGAVYGNEEERVEPDNDTPAPCSPSDYEENGPVFETDEGDVIPVGTVVHECGEGAPVPEENSVNDEVTDEHTGESSITAQPDEEDSEHQGPDKQALSAEAGPDAEAHPESDNESDDTAVRFGQMVADTRERCGLSREQLADAVGTSVDNIAAVENGTCGDEGCISQLIAYLNERLSNQDTEAVPTDDNDAEDAAEEQAESSAADETMSDDTAGADNSDAQKNDEAAGKTEETAPAGGQKKGGFNPWKGFRLSKK